MDLFLVAKISILTPLAGFFLAGLAGLSTGKHSSTGNISLNNSFVNGFSQIVTCVLMGICVGASGFLFYKTGLSGSSGITEIYPWIQCGNLGVYWGIKLDSLSTLMMTTVSLISFLVHIYSIGYMSHDKSIPRFMGLLSFFTFTMLTLVTAPNLLQLFFGWEGVGLASYLLIGFWYEKPAANDAALKAFLVNRVGDVGLVLGICALFFLFRTLDYDSLFVSLSSIAATGDRPFLSFWGNRWDALNVTGILLFIGAMGKSAQVGLHTWLADAMEGPTPVSALIHAATMVTAGVFLIIRMAPLYELAPLARHVICITGLLTACLAALVALTQNDIKRIIAYSTCSQLGYMFMAAGLSAYGVALFHLFTHAFFKALLFLGAGAVIHAFSDEQDIRRMGGIWKAIPFTYSMMWIGSLALAGIPFLAGYYSKDAILEAAYLHNSSLGTLCFYAGTAVATLTALYSWRLLFLAFHGQPHADDRVMARVHDAPFSMKFPLYILASGAIVAGAVAHKYFLGLPLAAAVPLFKNEITGYPVNCLPTLAALAGMGIAYRLYIVKPHLPDLLSNRYKRLYAFSLNKGYVDELYKRLFVEKIIKAGYLLWKGGDEYLIDRLGPNGVAGLVQIFSKNTSRLQTGYLNHYAFIMLAGVILLLSCIFFEGF